jgi:hypothetical protein
VLFLLIYGALVGRLSFVNLDIWGSGHDTRHQPLYRLGVLVGTLTFLAGIFGFVAILVKGAFTSPNSSISASQSASTKELSVKQTAVARREGAMLMSLRVALVSAIVVACFGVFRDVERKSMWGGSYFRSYFLSAVLFLIMSQLAYVVALFRIWRRPDRTGLAISFSSGIVEAAVHLPFFSSSMSSDPWSRSPLNWVSPARFWRTRCGVVPDSGKAMFATLLLSLADSWRTLCYGASSMPVSFCFTSSSLFELRRAT